MEQHPDLDAIRLTRPDLISLKIHRDPRGFSFLYPESWLRYEFDAGNGPGVLFAEREDDFGTFVSIEVEDLPTPVAGDDLPELERAFLSGLRKVPRSNILEHKAYDAGFIVGVEAKQAFEEEGERRRRWVRLLYNEGRQARLVAQGRNADEYEKWDIRFRPIMTTFNFGEVWPTA